MTLTNDSSYSLPQAHHIVTKADYLASQASGPWVESTSAAHPCHECHWVTNHGGKLDRPLTPGPARTIAELDELIDYLRDIKSSRRTGVTLAAVTKLMKEMGINKLYYALDPAYIPHANPILDAPGDIMHIFLCGLTRKELAWLIDIFIKAGYFTWDQLNKRIQMIDLPHGKRIPKLFAPTVAKKRRDMNLDLSASETMYFARTSIIVLEALIPAEARERPCWLCWLKHRAYLMMCLQHEFQRTDAVLLHDKAIAYIEAFVKVRYFIIIKYGYYYPRYEGSLLTPVTSSLLTPVTSSLLGTLLTPVTSSLLGSLLTLVTSSLLTHVTKAHY